MTNTPDAPQPYDPTHPAPREVAEDAAAKVRDADAPLPRLELRWRRATDDEKGYDAICEYGLVMPVDRTDIRSNEVDADGNEVIGAKSEVFYVFGTTSCDGSRCGREPGNGPFRDTSHAVWDSRKLGGLPVYVQTIDGDLSPLKVAEDAAVKERSLTAEERASATQIEISQFVRGLAEHEKRSIREHFTAALRAHAEQARAEGKAQGAAEERARSSRVQKGNDA